MPSARRMRVLGLWIFCVAAAVAIGCGGGAKPAGPGAAGTQGSVGQGGQTAGGGGSAAGGQSGSSASGAAGVTGTGGTGMAGTGSGGGQAAGTAGGPSDAGADAAAGGGGATGAGGAAPADAGADAGPAGRAFSCPPGPYEMPKAGAAQTICAGFNLRYGWSEGPTWNPSVKAFFFSNFVINAAGPGDMIKYTPETGQCEFFLENVGCNGLGLGANGKIIGACHTPRAVMEYDPVTKAPRTLASMAEGKMLDSPNDLIAHSNGTIYFSNPTFELGGRPQGLGNALVQISPAGVVSVIARGGLNGIALSPDEKKLYVVGMGVWDVSDTGVLSNQKGFNLGGDGIAVDCAGNIYDNSGTIRNPAGQTIGNFPGGTNMAFGGTDGKSLLVVANKTARIVPMNVPGIP